ncbi:MAG TPA: TetR/AcrR family transcriptional regulator [Candidatus Solibacter sp.]|nr:TetR/AcrR family transcriptional regulator [Candidatus Solibacter sp.]
MPTKKSEETNRKILDAALDLFREEGFDEATMRAIAARANVATGAAYYYFPSKDAIVLAFYERSCDEMQPHISEAFAAADGFEAKLREVIRVKLEYFAPNRRVLRALLRNGADPHNPISPFGSATKPIRDIDLGWFEKVMREGSIRIPRDLESELPGVLWLFQMGVIFFWIIDESPHQQRTTRLLELGARIVTSLLRISGLPLMRPVRKVALELIEIVKG